jgi:hypothetical protein
MNRRGAFEAPDCMPPGENTKMIQNFGLPNKIRLTILYWA